jgi:hypothetical protein
MKRSEQIGDLVAALAKAQAEFTPAVKESDNPYYGSKYADLAAVINAVRPALSKNGIAIMHNLESDLERRVSIVTVGLYLGEQFIEVEVEAPAVGKGKGGEDRFDVQTIGAAWTYLRRYSLQALCGLASEDDDGNLLQNDNKPLPRKQAPAPAPAQDTGVFGVMGDRLTCVIRAVFQKETAKKVKYLNVTFNGYVDTFNFATCFDTALFDALNVAKGKECQLTIKYDQGDKFVNIIDVLAIENVEYVKGKPGKREEEHAVAEG